MALSPDEQIRYANLRYKLGVDETQPIAECNAGHDVYPTDEQHVRRDGAGNRLCDVDGCDAMVLSYHGSGVRR